MKHKDCPKEYKGACTINCDNPHNVDCCFECSLQNICKKACGFIEEGFP